MNATFPMRDQHYAAFRQQPTVAYRRVGVFSRARNAISRALHACAKRVSKTRRLVREYDELTAMTDLELEDIGISRTDILAVVSGTYRRAHHSISDPAPCGLLAEWPSSEQLNPTTSVKEP